MTSSFIMDVPVAGRPQTCNMYAFRHYIARQNRFIGLTVLGELMILKIETQSRLNQHTNITIDLEPEVNRLRHWTQIVFCELYVTYWRTSISIINSLSNDCIR